MRMRTWAWLVRIFIGMAVALSLIFLAPALATLVKLFFDARTSHPNSTDDAWSLIQSFLGLFSLFITVFSFGAAVVTWWIQKKFEHLSNQNEKVEKLIMLQHENT